MKIQRAMQLLNSTAAVKELLNKLSTHPPPHKFQVQGYLHNVIEDKIAYDVYVDNWPNVEAIVTKPKQYSYKSLPMYRVGVYGNSKNICKMLSEPGFIPDDVHARFVGVPEDAIADFKLTAQKIGRELELTPAEPRFLFEYKAMPEMLEKYKNRLSDDFYMAPLNEGSDVETVCKYWKYGSLRYGNDLEASLRYLQQIGCSTLGVYTKDNDTLVSWLLSDIDRAGMSGHTLDEYRGKGIHIWALLAMIQAMHVSGDPMYGYVPVSNKVSFSNSQYVGAKLYDDKVLHFMLKEKTIAKL